MEQTFCFCKPILILFSLPRTYYAKKYYEPSQHFAVIFSENIPAHAGKMHYLASVQPFRLPPSIFEIFYHIYLHSSGNVIPFHFVRLFVLFIIHRSAISHYIVHSEQCAVCSMHLHLIRLQVVTILNAHFIVECHSGFHGCITLYRHLKCFNILRICFLFLSIRKLAFSTYIQCKKGEEEGKKSIKSLNNYGVKDEKRGWKLLLFSISWRITINQIESRKMK